MFLVPKVPLVEQQRRVMEENLAETVKGYTGAMGVDFWDRTAWQKEFNEADILVMTRTYRASQPLGVSYHHLSTNISQYSETRPLDDESSKSTFLS